MRRCTHGATNSFRVGMKIYRLIFIVSSIGFTCGLYGGEFICPDGAPTVADLGDGVTLHTCVIEKTPGVVVRVGPLELIKNGILILKTQTNANGKLHGSFASWDDNGNIMQQGNYAEGLKTGEWYVVDENGKTTTITYRQGIAVETR